MTDLKDIARQVRILTIRSLAQATSGHPGGSLSMIEIITMLHCEVMQPQPYHPDHAQDIFILSAGHKVPSLYALWGVLGWVDPADVLTLRQLGSPFQGHPSYPHQKWLHCSSGSLGIAASVSVGMALGRKQMGNRGRVYCLIGEGDLNEGITLESLRIASHYKLDNLCFILDFNQKMRDGESKIMVKPKQELEAFGLDIWTVDGHDFSALSQTFKMSQSIIRKPVGIIARTVKGKGVAAYESDPSGGHGSLTITDGDLQSFLEELEA